jgi:hypothetical protein
MKVADTTSLRHVGRVVAFGIPERNGIEGDWYMELAESGGRRVLLRSQGLRVAAERAGLDVGEVVTVIGGADDRFAVKRRRMNSIREGELQ